MTKQNKDPDGRKPVEPRPPRPPPQTSPQRPGGNPKPPTSTKGAPATAVTHSDHKSERQDPPGAVGDTTLGEQQPLTPTPHPSKTLNFEQEYVRLANSGFENQMTETTHIMVERLSKIVDSSDLDAFFLYKEETLAAEEALGPNSNYLFSKEALKRLEANIRAKSTLSNLKWGIDTSSRVPGNSALPGAVDKHGNPNFIGQQSPTSTMALQLPVSDQAKVVPDGSLFQQPRPPTTSTLDQFTEAQDITYAKLEEMVKYSNLDSFLVFKEELLSAEESLGPGPNYAVLKAGLQRIELVIRGANIRKDLNRGTNISSQGSGTGLNVSEVANAATVEAGPSKKKRQRKKKVGQEVVLANVSADELSTTMNTDVSNNLGQDAGLKQTIRTESSLANLEIGPDSVAQLTLGATEKVFDKTGESAAARDTEPPKKKGKKRRGKKKAQAGIDKGQLLAEKNATATGSSPAPYPPTADEITPEHTCGNKQNTRCSHTSWKNEDSAFSRALADTIRELLSITPLDSKLKLELHVDMNKVKRRVDEVEAAGGDVGILRASTSTNSASKKHLPAASSKGPFSAFGKLATPGLQRAAAIHLLSTPKYYNAFLDYIEHLNYLVACADEKAPAMADEADLIYNVVTTVYKEVGDNTRSKISVADFKKDKMRLTQSELHEQRLAESAKKMKELQELEQGIQQPNNPIPVTDKKSTPDPVPVRAKDSSPSETELETKALSLIKQPPVLRRFITDYNAMRANADASSSFWGQESHLIYQKLVDMDALPNLKKKSSTQNSRKTPLTPEDAIDALVNSTSDEETFTIGYEYLASSEVTPESRQTVASYYAADDTKFSTFLRVKEEIEERLASSNDDKLRRVRDEAEKIYECILKERSEREPEASVEIEGEAKPVISNPSKTRDFVDKVMRSMVNQFAISPTGIRRLIWPLKFIVEHPSIHEKTRAAAVCLLTDMSQLSEYEPFLQRAKNTSWYQPKLSTLIKLSAQEHVQLFMEAVGFMKTALESAPPRVLRHNANKNQLILPLTKRAGLPIKAEIFYNIRDYESAYTSALDDEGRASVNRDFCLPFLDCPKYFRETANELSASVVDYAAFVEQKNNLANLPACFGDTEVRQALVASSLLVCSALSELDLSSQLDRLSIMEAVAASGAYSVSPAPQDSLAICRDAFSSYLAAAEKVKTNFVREDIHFQVPLGISGCDKDAGPEEIKVHSNEHVPYVLGKWMPDPMPEAKAVAEQTPDKPSAAEEPSQSSTNHRVSEPTGEPPEELTPAQKKLKKQLIAANYRKAQKGPLSQLEIRAKARRIVSDSTMLSSFYKSKEAMEYDTGSQDSPDEKFFMNEINRIFTEMKKLKVDMDAGVGPQEPVRPTSSSMPPPTAQCSAPKEQPLTTDVPKSSTALTPPQNVIKTPVHPSAQCVTVHLPDSESRHYMKTTPAPTPTIPRDRVVAYSSLGLAAYFDVNAPPLPPEPEMAKECVNLETARAQRKSLAASYARPNFDYEYFQEFKSDAEEAVKEIDSATEKGYRARKMLSVLDNVDSMAQMMRYGEIRHPRKDSRRFHEAAADVLSDFDDRPGLMVILEALEQLFDDEAGSGEDPDAEPLVGPGLSKRLEELVVTVHYGLFIPEAPEDEMQEPIKQFPNIPCRAESIIDDVTRPFIGEKISMPMNQIAPPTLADAADVIRLALEYYPALSDLASAAIPLSRSGKIETEKLSEMEIQKVLGGLDAMPVPPQVVADLYKSGAPVSKIPRFTDADEAVAYMQSQIEGAIAPISVSISPDLSRSDIQEVGSSFVTDKHGVSVPDEYTVVPDSTPEGRALGKAMEDIQLSASKGDVPTDYQMAALGKARRELYASRLGKSSTDRPNNTTRKSHPSLSVSARAEHRAAANLLARSEAMALVGTKSFPNSQSAPSLKQRKTSFSPVGFPLPQPAPQPLQSPLAPRNNKPDALRMLLRTALTEIPLCASLNTVLGVQREVDRVFSSINDSSEVQECLASLRLPAPANEESQALVSLNKVFATYRAIRVVEEQRLEDLLDSAEEYRSGVVNAMAEVGLWNRGLNAALDTVDAYRVYNKRVMDGVARDVIALKAHAEMLQIGTRKKSRKSEKRVKGLGKKLGAHRKTTIEDFEAPVEYHGGGPKLGSFRVG